ncbi:type II secretion system protein [Cyanobacterium aponinum UTEX 3222]|uniref:PulJ/GspJ family protein n=1 Tax=Cyanobacterium aponinum TaxID=379064 RepID=UPI003089CA7B|nr:type II secretion system protein [Cyanobacterium aponinum UTEX 3222]
MNQYQLLKLFLSLKKSREKGISLTELIVALVISGIVLTAAASGFVNVLRANQSVESKTIRSSNLQKTLAFIQDEMKSARAVTRTSSSCSGSDSESCLVLTYPDGQEDWLDLNSDGIKDTCPSNPYIVYGYEDISASTSTEWLKPGLLKRKVFCDTQGGNWQVIADGLVSGNETNQPTTSCHAELSTTVYGMDSNDKGGFRFCLDTDDTDPATAPNNRLAQIFLYGHIDNNTNIPISVITFARSE